MEIVSGFHFNGIASGIKKKGERDLGLVYSEVPAVAAGMFTTNRVKAAPVLISMERISKGIAQALLVNSGNANACTGENGLDAARNLSGYLAKRIGVKEEMVLPSSTGVIGVPLPVEKVREGIPALVEGLSPHKIDDFADAILTTDTFRKVVRGDVAIGGKQVRVWGVAKGAGMIMPDMATMLSYLVSDAAVEPLILKALLKEGVDGSFHRITIDGETSTNDAVIMLANGMSGNPMLSRHSTGLRRFRDCLFKVLGDLSQMVVQDGEGASKLVEIRVEKARSGGEARAAAFAVANSPLVKTALFGEEVNWGRIMAALGRCGASIDANTIDISFGGVQVARNGVACGSEEEAGMVLKQRRIRIVISLNRGRGSFHVSTTDLTPQYVALNSSYRS